MENNTVLETERLYFRRMTKDDFGALSRTLQDPVAMRAYEHAFSDDEVRAWIEKQLVRYEKYGFGLWAVILKETGELIGQCGLTVQDIEGREALEVGYLFERARWHSGYATEAAVACRDYAFNVLGADEVCSIIRDTNIASQNVARRNGMRETGRFVKHYYGIDMPHIVFSVKRDGLGT